MNLPFCLILTHRHRPILARYWARRLPCHSPQLFLIHIPFPVVIFPYKLIFPWAVFNFFNERWMQHQLLLSYGIVNVCRDINTRWYIQITSGVKFIFIFVGFGHGFPKSGAGFMVSGERSFDKSSLSSILYYRSSISWSDRPRCYLWLFSSHFKIDRYGAWQTKSGDCPDVPTQYWRRTADGVRCHLAARSWWNRDCLLIKATGQETR